MVGLMLPSTLPDCVKHFYCTHTHANSSLWGFEVNPHAACVAPAIISLKHSHVSSPLWPASLSACVSVNAVTHAC